MYHHSAKMDRGTKAVQDSHVTLSKWVFSLSECHCLAGGRLEVEPETANTYTMINLKKKPAQSLLRYTRLGFKFALSDIQYFIDSLGQSRKKPKLKRVSYSKRV